MSKRGIYSKLIAVVMSLVLITSITQVSRKDVNAFNAGKVVISVEKFTIGEGFIVEPVEVTFIGDTSVADVFKSVMKKQGIEYVAGSGENFYLSEIKNVDDGNYNIPEKIANMDSYTSSWTGTLTPPSNDDNLENDDNNLGEYDYSFMAGWMYCVNEIDPGLYASGVSVEDGDVIRFQFSIHGYGADLGRGYGDIAALELPDKSELLKCMATINSFDIITDEVKTCYDEALAVAASYDVTQDDVDNMTKKIKALLPQEVETTTPEVTTTTTPEVTTTTTPEVTTTTSPKVTTTTTTNVTVKASKVSKIVRDKKGKKAKLTFKKVKGASGYQVKYSTSKKFSKKYTIINTYGKYVTTIKNLKAGTKYYVKVRAIKKVGKKKYYSSWSAAKVIK